MRLKSIHEYKLTVIYLISLIVIGTIVPTVYANSTVVYSLDSEEPTASGDNQPPHFGTPTPNNGSTHNPLNLNWNIPISDPEGNIFSWTIQCSNGQMTNESDAVNWTKTLVVSDLTYSMTYVVWVNATDSSGSGAYTRQWYTFTTKPLPAMNVNITKPLQNTLYIQDQKLRGCLTNHTIIYGPITITANVSSETRIDRVEFYINERLKATDTAAPYFYVWNSSFTGLSLTSTITVVAYNNAGERVSTELDVIKWQFHPLLALITVGALGSVIASKFIQHTRVSGIFVNVQQTMNMTSFYALRIHYSSRGPITQEQGVVTLKTCTGGMSIGPISLCKIGPLHNIVIGTFTFLGDIRYVKNNFREGFTQNSLAS